MYCLPACLPGHLPVYLPACLSHWVPHGLSDYTENPGKPRHSDDLGCHNELWQVSVLSYREWSMNEVSNQCTPFIVFVYSWMI